MGKKKGGGKKKKSKEQLEQERIEFEEQERIRLEEEARVFAEEEKLRLEREEQERIERERLRAEELERLQDEGTRTRTFVERRQRYLDQYIQKRNAGIEWREYLKCSPLPALEDIADLNTYLEGMVKDRATELDEILGQCQKMQVVVDNLQTLCTELLSKGRDALVGGQNEKVSQVFRSQVKRIDYGTAHILTHATEYVNPKMEVLLARESNDFKVGVWLNVNAKGGYRMKIIEFPDISLVAEIPKTLATQNIAIRMIQCRNDSVTVPAPGSSHPEAYDTALGGVVFLETLKLPPPRKNVKGWSMMPFNQAVHDRVQRLNFNAEADLNDTSGTPGTSAISVPLKFKIGRDVIVRDVAGKHCPLPAAPSKGAEIDDAELADESAVVDSAAADAIGEEKKDEEKVTVRAGAWDPVKQSWTEEGITDAFFDPASRVVSLTTARMTAMALVQPRCVDQPLQVWSLQPVFPAPVEPGTLEDDSEDSLGDNIQEDNGVSSVLLSLMTGTNWAVKVQVGKNGLCKLVEPLIPELDEIRGCWLAADLLLTRLARAGLNIIAPICDPKAEKALNGQVQLKNAELEKHIYDEISAAAAASFSVASTKFNRGLGADQASILLHQAPRDKSHESMDIVALLQEEQAARSKSSDQAQTEAPEEQAEAAAAAEDATAQESTREEDGEPKEGSGEQAEEKEDGEDAAPKTGRSTTSKTSSKGEPLGTARSSKSSGSKKKGGKKGKKSKAEPVEAQADNQAAIEEEGKEEEVEEEADPVPHEPRVVLFETDAECLPTGMKCSFLRVKESDDSFFSALSKEQVTHTHLENALLKANIYEEQSVRLMQDDPTTVPLRFSLANLLKMIRPLSFTTSVSR